MEPGLCFLWHAIQPSRKSAFKGWLDLPFMCVCYVAGTEWCDENGTDCRQAVQWNKTGQMLLCFCMHWCMELQCTLSLWWEQAYIMYLDMVTIYLMTTCYTGLFEMIVGVLTTCHAQYTWDRSICILLFNRTTLQVLVTFLTGALYVHPLWFYKHQNDNWVHSKLFVACQRWWLQWQFWFVPPVLGYKGCTYRAPVRYVTKTWIVVLLNKKIHILLSQVYCVWHIVKTPTIISNNPVYCILIVWWPVTVSWHFGRMDYTLYLYMVTSYV